MEQNLAALGQLKEITKRYGFHFTKSLGQNFLIDRNILDKIVDTAEIGKEDIVIEVGTGIGTLTKELAKRAKKVYAVEIDKNLIPIVKETTVEYENVVLIHQDFLEVSLEDMIIEKNEKIKVIANIPYYITTPIIMKCLETNIFVDTMLLMIQREVADRLSAKPSTKEYGSLSVAVQYYADVEFVSRVSKSSFYPQPKVDSGIIKLKKRETFPVKLTDTKLFFQVVRGAFAKRRKTVINSMTGFCLEFTKDVLQNAFCQTGIDEKRRGETLNIDEFALLSNTLTKIISEQS